MQIPDHVRDEQLWPRRGSIGQYLAEEFERRTGIDTRVTLVATAAG